MGDRFGWGKVKRLPGNGGKKELFARFNPSGLAAGRPQRSPGGLIAAAGAVCLALCLAACTVVPIDQAESNSANGQSGSFNANAYAASIWASKVVPTVTGKAVDLTTLIPAMQKDPQSASKKYGLQTNGVYNYIVKGQGKVTKVDTSSPIGVATVDLGSGLPPVTIQVGPLILDESLRDAVGFISFDQFTNQIQYGAVSQALNTLAVKDALGNTNPTTLQGKTISFYGTFSFTDLQHIKITPVKLDVKG